MENTRPRWPRALYLPALAVLVALVAAVSSWAASESTLAAPSQSAVPAAQQDTIPVQAPQDTPAEPDGQAPSGRSPGDCPQRDGDSGVGAAGGSDSSSAPAAPADGSEV